MSVYFGVSLLHHANQIRIFQKTIKFQPQTTQLVSNMLLKLLSHPDYIKCVFYLTTCFKNCSAKRLAFVCIELQLYLLNKEITASHPYMASLYSLLIM